MNCAIRIFYCFGCYDPSPGCRTRKSFFRIESFIIFNSKLSTGKGSCTLYGFPGICVNLVQFNGCRVIQWGILDFDYCCLSTGYFYGVYFCIQFVTFRSGGLFYIIRSFIDRDRIGYTVRSSSQRTYFCSTGRVGIHPIDCISKTVAAIIVRHCCISRYLGQIHGSGWCVRPIS